MSSIQAGSGFTMNSSGWSRIATVSVRGSRTMIRAPSMLCGRATCLLAMGVAPLRGWWVSATRAWVWSRRPLPRIFRPTCRNLRGIRTYWSVGSGVPLSARWRCSCLWPDHWGPDSEEWAFHITYQGEGRPKNLTDEQIEMNMRLALGIGDLPMTIHKITRWALEGVLAAKFR